MSSITSFPFDQQDVQATLRLCRYVSQPKAVESAFRETVVDIFGGFAVQYFFFGNFEIGESSVVFACSGRSGESSVVFAYSDSPKSVSDLK